MKDAPKEAYGMSVNELKAQFFSASLDKDETAIQFTARLMSYFNQWLSKDGATETVEDIKDKFFRAQFIKSCPEEITARIKMDKIKSLKDMKETANAYGKKSKRVKSA